MLAHLFTGTSCTKICFAFTICVSILLTDFLVLRIGLGFDIILYYVIGT